MKAYILFCLLWVFIGYTSSYDAYLSLKYKKSLQDLEENPIGRCLIDASNGDVSLFLGCKMAGTITALGILSLYYRWRPISALAVITAIAIFQAILMVYILGA